jgi:hypothetical protein
MLIAMNIRQNSRAVLLRRKAARRKAFWLFAILQSLRRTENKEKTGNETLHTIFHPLRTADRQSGALRLRRPGKTPVYDRHHQSNAADSG